MSARDPVKLKATKRQSVDAWLERFLRRDSTLANPESTMGGQLDRLLRNSMDSAGREFKKEIARPVFNDEGQQIGEQIVDYLVVKDDSGAFNASFRADEMFADHGVDLMVWASLDAMSCRILQRQREPVQCRGGWENARKQTPDKTTCKHEQVRPLPERTRIGLCDSCASTFTLDAKGKVDKQLVCKSCGLPQRTYEHEEPRRKGRAARISHKVEGHVQRVRIKVQRKLADRREGDGTELIRTEGQSPVDEQGFAWMYVYEVVKRDNAEIAAELNISERQLRRYLTEARTRIAAALEDVEPVLDEGDVANRKAMAQARALTRWLDEARWRTSLALQELGLRWGLLYLEDDAEGVTHVRRREIPQ